MYRLLTNSSVIDSFETIMTILYSLLESDYTKEEIVKFINIYYRRTRILLIRKSRKITSGLKI